MGTVIGRTLPLAVAIAVSPLPIIVAVLILVSGQARTKSVGYLVGRICGFAVVVTVVALLVGATSGGDVLPQHPSTAASILRICFGCALIAVPVGLWRRRAGRERGPNRALQRVERVTPAGAFGIGLALVVLDVSTLVPGIMGGLDIGEARLSAARAVGAGAIFLAVALASCIAPIGAYLIAGDRLDGPLAAAKTWLVANDRTVMTVLATVVGALLIGRGIEALTTPGG
ncbi:GAP family protein [Nocardia veterana]|uniref:GAP family protein n=1 Tax=Nocardia veterana TaxID=132249 RepID=A0A7X6LY17_9NOCA|nr:GAP family protein [Nocardia veterana]NKY85857.1 GAP family protein [Nocardia veterana]